MAAEDYEDRHDDEDRGDCTDRGFPYRAIPDGKDEGAPAGRTARRTDARRSRLRLLSAALLAASVLLFGRGLWIYAKAQLAQVLLHRAWARTMNGGGAEHVKPWPWADTWPVARLSIPSEHADFIVLAGASGRTLAFGPGHLDGSADPGTTGNCVLSAHRDTQFSCLRRLSKGDLLVLETRQRRRVSYRVTSAAVVDRASTRLLEPTGDATLTLVTCYPFDAIVPGGRLRYVVTAASTESPDTGKTM